MSVAKSPGRCRGFLHVLERRPLGLGWCLTQRRMAMSMTEASGLTGDPARIDHAADAIRGMTKDMVAELPARPT